MHIGIKHVYHISGSCGCFRRVDDPATRVVKRREFTSGPSVVSKAQYQPSHSLVNLYFARNNGSFCTFR